MRSKKLLEELKNKHREVKHEVLTLFEKMNTPNMTKAKIQDEIFKIYKLIK